MDVVDKIINGDYSAGEKLLKLYSVVMVYYRQEQELVDKAWVGLRTLFNNDESMSQAFAFLTGFLVAYNPGSGTDKFKDLIREDLSPRVL